MARAFPLNQIGFVMLGVADPAASAAFYQERLGMEIANQNEGFVFLRTNGTTLVLSKELNRSLGDAPGSVEVVFSVDHVRLAYDELVAHGIEFRNAPRAVAGPMWAADFRDPDGHALSIFGPE